MSPGNCLLLPRELLDPDTVGRRQIRTETLHCILGGVARSCPHLRVERIPGRAIQAVSPRTPESIRASQPFATSEAPWTGMEPPGCSRR